MSDIKISKLLSYVLRHKPEAIGLTLDAEGWAEVDELIAKADMPLTAEMIRDVVATNDKKRFALSADGRLIRANQGHSIKVDLGLQPVSPPEFLYHGTATRFLASIQESGLTPQSRQYVHLSADRETAAKVGARHGKLVILTVKAQEMHQAGQAFYQAKNGVWLADHVAPDYLTGYRDC